MLYRKRSIPLIVILVRRGNPGIAGFWAVVERGFGNHLVDFNDGELSGIGNEIHRTVHRAIRGVLGVLRGFEVNGKVPFRRRCRNGVINFKNLILAGQNRNGAQFGRGFFNEIIRRCNGNGNITHFGGTFGIIFDLKKYASSVAGGDKLSSAQMRRNYN